MEESLPGRIAGKKISDNISITYFDRSRKITGDRWMVELTGEVEIPVSETFWHTVKEADKNLLNCIREKIGEMLHFSVTRNQNFVDEKEKQKILDMMVKRFEENIIHYLDNPDFTQKLFLKKFNEAKTQCLSVGYQTPEAEGDPTEDDDQGPADFSHLFK